VKEAPTLVPARWVSGAVLDLAAGGPLAGSVTARFGATLHVEVEGFVIAVLPATAARMPNGLSIHGGVAGRRGVEVGDRVALNPDGLEAGGLAIGWDRARPPRWDATVPSWTVAQRERLGHRANEIIAAGMGIDGFHGDDGDARDGVESLLAAVRSGDPGAAGHAGRRLVGRGPGLTPLGDDILAAAALTVRSVGGASGSASARQRAWLSALVPPDLRKRTTAVSATLLELAIRGFAIGPVHALLDPVPRHDRRLPAELDRIQRFGHTTGAAYAATIGTVALALAQPTLFPNQATKEHAR
jgi:hypothetical protein